MYPSVRLHYAASIRRPSAWPGPAPLHGQATRRPQPVFAAPVREIGACARKLSAPQNIVWDPLIMPAAPTVSPWLNLLEDEVEPKVLFAKKPVDIIWCALWRSRPNDTVHLTLSAVGSETLLRFTLRTPGFTASRLQAPLTSEKPDAQCVSGRAAPGLGSYRGDRRDVPRAHQRRRAWGRFWSAALGYPPPARGVEADGRFRRRRAPDGRSAPGLRAPWAPVTVTHRNRARAEVEAPTDFSPWMSSNGGWPGSAPHRTGISSSSVGR